MVLDKQNESNGKASRKHTEKTVNAR